MTRQDEERQVEELLTKRRKLARFGLQLSPRDRLLLQRLLYRLGWTRGEYMRPKRAIKYAVQGAKFEEHNQLIKAIKDADNEDLEVQRITNPHTPYNSAKGDATSRLVFADWLQENSVPGAHIVRQHAQGIINGTRTKNPRVHDFRGWIQHPEEYEMSPVYGFGEVGREQADTGDAWDALGKSTGLGTWLQTFHVSPDRKRRGVIIGVNHAPPGESSDARYEGITHSALARTPEEMRQLLSDFPQDQVADIIHAHRHWLRRKPIEPPPTEPTTMQRRVVKYALKRPPLPTDPLIHHAAAAMDNPTDNAALMSFADHLADSSRDPELSEAFQGWVQGQLDFRKSLMPLIHPKHIKGYMVRGPYVREHNDPDPPEVTARIYKDEPHIEMRQDREPGREWDSEQNTYVEKQLPEELPTFAKRNDEPGWHIRVPDRSNRRSLVTRRVRGRRLMSSVEVADALNKSVGPRGLVHLIIGLRHFHPEGARVKTGDRTVKFRRPRKYAKIDGHEQAHPLVHGFPIEHALRHITNDPKLPSHVRDTAWIALTGKNKLTGEVNPDGMPDALWALHDQLQEVDHPLAANKKGGYNWMSAADKVRIDRHTHTALHEIAEGMRQAHGLNPTQYRWDISPEGQAMRISQALESQRGLAREVATRNKEMLEKLRGRVMHLSGTTDPKQVDESLRRHAHRAQYLWRIRHGAGVTNPGEGRLIKDEYRERATQPLPEPWGKGGDAYDNEKATRYARLTLSPPRKFTGPGGEAMHEHSYSDESGKELGVVRVHPRNDGKTLHIHWIGPKSGTASGEAINSIGSEGVKSIKAGLKTHYPQAEFLTGVRTGGFRKANPERVVVPFRRVVVKYSMSSLVRANSPLDPVSGAENEESIPVSVMDELHHHHANMLAAYTDLAKELMDHGLDKHARIANWFADEHRNHKMTTMYLMRTHGQGWPEWAKETDGLPDPTDEHYTVAQNNIRRVANSGIEDAEYTVIKPKPELKSRVQGPYKVVVRYSHKAFQDAIGSNELDMTNRGAYADWLEENAPETVSRENLNRLRNYQGRLWVGLSPGGKVHAIPRLTRQHLEGGTRYVFEDPPKSDLRGTHKSIIKRSNSVRVNGRMQTWKRRPEAFRVPWKFGMYGPNGEFNERNVHQWLTENPYGEPDSDSEPPLEPEKPSTPSLFDNSPEQMRRRYKKQLTGTFIDALRRAVASNSQALKQAGEKIARRIGAWPTKTFSALHDTPQGATPGIAQVVYGRTAPEQVHALASWVGLVGNLPGVGVFHARPGGPDLLHRFRAEGSGMDLRGRLDRAGISQRVLIPHGRGFDVLVPDRGGTLYPAVKQYTNHHRSHLQTSTGHFNTVGSTDQAAVRDTFRNRIAKAEAKMTRRGTVKKYALGTTHADFHRAIHENPEEKTNQLVYADFLEEQGFPHAAELIRRSTQEGSRFSVVSDHSIRQESSGPGRPTSDMFDNTFGGEPTARVGVFIPSASHPRSNLMWYATVPMGRARELKQGLENEGFSDWRGDRPHPEQDPKFLHRQRVVKLAAKRVALRREGKPKLYAGEG